LHIIEKAKLNNELVLNQLKEHYLSVIQVAAYFIKRNIKVEVKTTKTLTWLPAGWVALAPPSWRGYDNQSASA
jgi:hypothetical protein